MLSNSLVHPTIPTTNLERARAFYEDVLGLTVSLEREDGVVYRCGGTYLTLFERATASSGEHTVASWQVENLDEVADELIARGVEFDTFEMPGMELNWDDRGILDMGEMMRGGWFRDPDGNVLAIGQFPLE
jgi:catechol 2,3-dioxygenase-like lactoylglutathione lyase family enzyme